LSTSAFAWAACGEQWSDSTWPKPHGKSGRLETAAEKKFRVASTYYHKYLLETESPEFWGISDMGGCPLGCDRPEGKCDGASLDGNMKIRVSGSTHRSKDGFHEERRIYTNMSIVYGRAEVERHLQIEQEFHQAAGITSKDEE
jgi:hypothetical protein